ncbi:MAG TPA: metal-dependent transcriptional regulator [Solirubrobacterales bacterium]|nr:metal-dependent transcriptional regulator [Solirubrobacterales bacterium]
MGAHAHSGFRRDPAAANTEAVEDYAKAVHALSRQQEGPVGTSALAERLGVSPGTVTAMLKRMAEIGLVEHEPYHGVMLTPAGEKVALEVIRHHRLIEAYLAEALGMPWDRVHNEAEVLEHYISEELEERMAEALGDPAVDPHGDPIPDRRLSLRADEGVSLAELEAGEGGVLGRVSDSDPEMLRYLDERGIRPGVRITVSEREPFGRGIVVELSGGDRHPIGEALARRMVVG